MTRGAKQFPNTVMIFWFVLHPGKMNEKKETRHREHSEAILQIEALNKQITSSLHSS